MNVWPDIATCYLPQPFIHVWDQKYLCGEYEELSGSSAQMHLFQMDGNLYINVPEKPQNAVRMRSWEWETHFSMILEE